MAVPEKQDIVESGLDYLIRFWQDKPVARGILKSQLKELQKLEDVVYKLLTERGIYSAIGKQLDVLGTFAGEDREGREDELYRQAILRRLSINNSDGTIPVVLDILKSLSGTENPTLYEHYPALVVSEVSHKHTHKLAKINDEIMAAGVCGLLSYNYGNTAFVASELQEQDELYITNDNNLIELDDNTYLAAPSFIKEWDNNGTSFLPEMGEDVNPLAELFNKKDYFVDEGLYITNDNNLIELDDGSFLLWQTAEEI